MRRREAPTFIGSASFEIHNERDAAPRVSVNDIEWLVASGCPPSREIEAVQAPTRVQFDVDGEPIVALAEH